MPYTLLLADSSTTIQRVIALTFANEDITVVAFSDGGHAIASLERAMPDIVLADIGMPGRNGYEVARHIKRTPSLAHIPVLLLTGAFEPVDQAKAVETGCDGVLVKPFDPHVVVARVKELLKPRMKADQVEHYFEELDQAFATLAAAEPPAFPTVVPPQDDAVDAADASNAAAAPTPQADASGAPLAAERSGPVEPRTPAPMPASSPSLPPTEELIEQVARRVLERMSDAIVKGTVTDIVHATAERLVREEIVRIKSNIK